VAIASFVLKPDLTFNVNKIALTRKIAHFQRPIVQAAGAAAPSAHLASNEYEICPEVD